MLEKITGKILKKKRGEDNLKAGKEMKELL